MKAIIIVLAIVALCGAQVPIMPQYSGCLRATYMAYTAIWQVQMSKLTWNPMVYSFYYSNAARMYQGALVACGIPGATGKVDDLLAFTSPAKAWDYWVSLNPLLKNGPSSDATGAAISLF
jgi:hypothetical protein